MAFQQRQRRGEVVQVAVVEGDRQPSTAAGVGRLVGEGGQVDRRPPPRQHCQLLVEILRRHAERPGITRLLADPVIHEDAAAAPEAYQPSLHPWGKDGGHPAERHPGLRATTATTTGYSGSATASSFGRSSRSASPCRNAVADKTLPNAWTSTDSGGK